MYFDIVETRRMSNKVCLKPLVSLVTQYLVTYMFIICRIGEVIVGVRAYSRVWKMEHWEIRQCPDYLSRLRRRSVERVALQLCKSSIILCSRACDPTVDHFATLLLLAVLSLFPKRQESQIRNIDIGKTDMRVAA